MMKVSELIEYLQRMIDENEEIAGKEICVQKPSEWRNADDDIILMPDGIEPTEIFYMDGGFDCVVIGTG